MKIINFIFYFIILESTGISAQNFDVGQVLNPVPSTFKLIDISSKDNSKIYRYAKSFPTTVFSFTVDKYELKIHNNIIVSCHFVLFPKDNLLEMVPTELIKKIEDKSGRKSIFKNSNYYFDDESSKTTVFRKNIPEYGGDRIHVWVYSTNYLAE